MRIAQVAPLIESVPPKAYGGIERVVHYLTEELVRRGHDVTLFASGDSQTSARHIAVVDESLRQSTKHADPVVWHTLQLAEVVRRAHEFDIVHFHFDVFHFPIWRYLTTPQVTTLHGRLDIPDMDRVYLEYRDMSVVSISNSQRKPLAHANWAATVYNGIPLDTYTFREQPGDYFAFLGRISPEKGPLDAIEIAKRCGTPLKIAAKIDKVDQEYFETMVQPLLEDPLIEFIGEVDEAGKNELLGHAKALLFPINWPEPFGLVMVESMACGTPVIAYDRGSVQEVMKDGVTGFIVNDLDEALQAIGRLDSIDRRQCRVHFSSRFTSAQMTSGYLHTYSQLTAQAEMTKYLRLRANGYTSSRQGSSAVSSMARINAPLRNAEVPVVDGGAAAIRKNNSNLGRPVF
jgi:glycosyltransferase involved in cell wall biosynthesis